MIEHLDIDQSKSNGLESHIAAVVNRDAISSGPLKQNTTANGAMPRANEAVHLSGKELAIYQAVNETPDIKSLYVYDPTHIEDHHLDQQISAIVSHVLDVIFNHSNTQMYTDPQHRMEVMHELAHEVTKFKNELKIAPKNSLPLQNLYHRLRSDSRFVGMYLKHGERHHPETKNSFEPHGAKTTIQCGRENCVHEMLHDRLGQHHYHGKPGVH